MVKDKYEEEKQKAKLQLQNITAVSLTSDMWTSINMDAYLALTCHNIDASTTLRSTVLGVVHFPEKHCCKSSYRQNLTHGGMGDRS